MSPDNNDAHEFSLADAPLGASITAGDAFSWTPTELQDGNHTFTVTVRDSAGATDSETITVTVREVNVPPVLNSIGSRSVNELVTLAFTATVTDPDNNEQHIFSLADAPLGASITAGGAFSWTPTEPQDGTHTVTISVQDRFGATDSETITVTVREVNVPPALVTIGGRFVNELEALTFDAAVLDPDNNDVHTFSLGGAPTGAAITQDGTFSWTPTEPQDGIHHVIVTVRDRAGGTDSENVTVTVQEVNVPPALVTIGDRSVDELETLSFTATVTDPDNNDVHTFSLVGAPTGAAITQDGTFSWTPTEPQDGSHTFTVTVRDHAGATDSETITVTVNEVDHIRPMPLVGTGERNPTGSHRIAFWADFGERIRAGSFAAGDISVSSGRATPPSSSDGQNFTFAVTGAGEGTLTVSIPENAVQDIEGNWNEESNTASILVDRTAPVPTLNTTASSPTGAARIPFTATFDEPVDGETVEAGDIDASSGGVENLQFGGTTSFTFEIVGPATGTLRVGIPAGMVQDLAGNGNAASNMYEIVIDRDGPAPAVTALTGSPTNAPAVGFRVDFDKDINPSSFAAGDVDASSGTVSSPVEVNSREFTFSVSGPEDGSLTVAIPSGRVQDTSGNLNIVSNTATVEIDRTGPKPEITPVTASPTNAQTVTFEVGFGEEIRSGTFGSGDIEASSGRAAGVRAAGDSRFTFDVTGAGSGTLEVRIPAGGLQDVPGNDNTESNTATIGIDRNRPVPTITAETASPTNAQEIRFRVDFDKDVDASTFDAADIVMVPSRGEVSSLTQAGPRAFTFVVGDPAEGELLVRIPASRLQDTLGNPNVASNATGVTIDRTAPTPKLEAQTPSPTNSTGIVFKVDFGEQVRDGSFAASGIRVDGGFVASGPDGTDGRTFEFTVRPSGDGRVTARIPAGSAQDPAGNDNAGSNTASALYDGTAPQITAAYLVSPGRVSVLYGELVDAAYGNGSGFSIPGRTVSANTDPALRSGIVTLSVAGAAGGDLLSYDRTAGSVSDAAGNAAQDDSATLVEVEGGAVPLPPGSLQRFELPPQVSTVEVGSSTLPPEVVAPGRLALDFSSAPTFLSDDPAARTTVTLTDSASNLTAPAGRVAVTVSLPAGVGAEAGSSWDGSFNLPSPSGVGPPAPGQLTVHTKRVAVSVGSDTPLHLDRAVRILIPGEGGQRVFFSEGGGPQRAVQECAFADSQEAADAGLLAGEDCHIDVGRDLAIWTRHLSHWGTYHAGPRVVEPEPEPVPEPEPEEPRGSGGSRGGGGGGGGGGAPEEIITDVRIYSVSWDCTAGTVSATVGPDTGQLSVRMRTSSAGERPVERADSSLPGSRAYTTAMSGADQFVVVEANVAYEGDQVITKIVNFRECSGSVTIDRYEPPSQEPAGTTPRQQEICRDGREPALRDGSRLLCLFPGTFDVLAERGWSLTRP